MAMYCHTITCKHPQTKITNSVWCCKTAHIKKHMNSIKSTAVATIIVTGIGMQSTGTPDWSQTAML
jgi:hypothetical protein